jgi:hypothetical protein
MMTTSSSTSEDALASARLKLRHKINSWRKTQLDRYPHLRDELDPVNLAEPENERLMIPSQFSDAHRRSFGIQELAKVERSLREGQAHDALDKLRLAIQTFNYNTKFKVDNVRGQRPNTRAQQFLSSLSKDKVGAADKYRRVRTALLALGLPEDDLSLQPLLNDNCGVRMKIIQQRRGTQRGKILGIGWSEGQADYLPARKQTGRSKVRNFLFFHMTNF